jgi:hypothetical protein
MEGLHSSVAEGQARQAEVQRVKELVMEAVGSEIEQIAELFVSKKDNELFGRTEFQLRDLLLKLGTRVIEAVLEDRKKGGTKAAAPPAWSARAMPALSVGGAGR